MKRKPNRIRRWLVLAGGVAVLALPAGANAMLVDEAAGGAQQPQAPVVVTTGGFDWSDALVGAGVALGIVLSGAVVAQAARNRRRLATLL